MRKTKIICTLGPKTKGIYEELIMAGMDAARVNFSHETYEGHKLRINEFKKAREKLQKPIPLIMDTRGPEIRIGLVAENAFVKQGQDFVFVNEDVIGDSTKVSLKYSYLYEALGIGANIFIDDGKIRLIVKEVNKDSIVCEVMNSGKISSRKGINIPDFVTHLDFLSKQDEEDILFALEHDFDYIALSFVRDEHDVKIIRDLLERENKSHVKIISKVEHRKALENIDEIIDCSDGIMIGRGDLGIEISLEEVPIVQKTLIRKCYSRGKPVITATQMLESMTENALPTRAEVSDVANAIYDGTSAVMLSGETAIGNHPTIVVDRMVSIINKIESDIDYRNRFFHEDWLNDKSIVSVVGQATTVAAFELNAKAVIALTNSGNTARMVARFRPDCPIIAVTVNESVKRQLNLSWGIYPVNTDYIPEINDLFENTIDCAKRTGIVKDGDLTILTAGMPTGESGKTNFMKVHKVGEPFFD